MTTKVVKGSLWTLAGHVTPLGVSLFTTPFVIRLLGSEGYGLLVLVGLIPTYFAFADFGMGVASTRFASDAFAETDPKKEGKAVVTAAAIVLAVSSPVVIGIWVFSHEIIGLFNVAHELRPEASVALKIASITFSLTLLSNVFNTPQLTRLRMDLSTFVNSGFRILGLIATPIVIYFTGGILGAVAVLLIIAALTCAAHLLVSGRLLRELFEWTIDGSMIRPMLKFGWPIVILGIANVLLFNSEKALLAALISVEALAFYSVGYTLAAMMIMLSNTLIQSLIPAFSQLASGEDRAALEDLFGRMVKLAILGLIPAGALLCTVARDFFRIWAGESFERNSTIPFLILIVGLFFSVPGYVPYSLLMSQGRANLIARLYWIEIPLYLGLLVLLTTYFGIVGAAAAWSIRVAIDGIMFFAFASRTAGIRPGVLVTRNWWIPMAMALYGLPVLINVFSPTPQPMVAYIGYCMSTLVYGLLVWNFALIPAEKLWIKGWWTSRPVSA